MESWNQELSEYIKQGEPNQKNKAKIWGLAIGLQDVDGLKTSTYLMETAKEHIEGNIDIEEANNRINSYYKIQDDRNKELEETEEADKVSVRITELLSEKTFNFSPVELSNIHKRLFSGIYKSAGKYREYNFTKEEWVLDGDTVIYASYDSVKETLKYDFEQERNFSYQNLDIHDTIGHISRFISNIWQVHPFCEGNTRTVAVFLIKYLRSFGFNVNEDVFKENSLYFRNALVRANYNNVIKGVYEDITFLNNFFYNLLTTEKYELKNRLMHINNIVPNKLLLTEDEQMIINLIKENSTITQEEISKKINKSLRTVKTYMQDLQEKNIISRKNGKKNGEWVINYEMEI